ncbi:carbon storage regulator CsrA [Gudongella oleilytica]|jgi:carbon storage regulator|uniref:carbon storage regulator CsrA n=1 Tax=Gudongella oleilytica TaxID=1582259 RepID=UPI002A366166|nr:carbon storage regulator CsrA [Gudongella oleilytica]MDY0256546.1 carbon storage regulator CsrA [Gudongella oleilytica]HMM68963.1 carbon storage regulator CsrA [Gudongella oleilytica]
MLVLNRKLGESIMLGDNIEIRILEMADGKVKIGIEAPRDLTILRKEVYDQVVEENKNAINNQVDPLTVLRQNSK